MRRSLPALLWLVLAAAAGAEDSQAPWITLFDGKNLDGWKINAENPDTWTLKDGILTAHGPRSHIFYVGKEAPFKDFELELEVMTRPNSNSGIYFHTEYQDSDWPKAGFECQVNNTHKDWKKTGSLYDIQNVTEPPAKDNEWFTYNIKVVGKTVTNSINGKPVMEYTEPEGTKAGAKFDRVIGQGTFALQGHDPDSTVSYRNIRVRKLGAAPAKSTKESPVAFLDNSAGLKVGDPAPSFTLKDDAGKDWKSDEHLKKGITVVYFYPADMTPGCTKQACAYRDDLGKLTSKGIQVVGVSGDTVEDHQWFKKAHMLNFPLLADPKGEVATKFGVPVTVGEKTVKATIDGQEVSLVRGATAQRWTFIFKDGKVAAINNKVDAAGDSAAIQETIEGLK